MQKRLNMKHLGLFIMLLVIFVLTSCYQSPSVSPNSTPKQSSNPSASQTPPPSNSPTPSSTPSASEQPTASVEPSPSDIPVIKPASLVATLAIGGDVLIDGSTQRILETTGEESLVDPSIAKMTSEADLSLVNLETTVSSRGTPTDGKEYNYRAKPENLKKLVDYTGFDIVSLANNHSLDYGKTAFLDTLTHLDEMDVDYIGAGKDLAEAEKILYKEVNGLKLAVIGVSRLIPYGYWYAKEDRPGVFGTYYPERPNEVIAEARKNADYVIVYAHWGIMYESIHAEYQTKLAHGYIDAGADLVVGAHPHILQGFEYYNGKLICYSLSNYIFTSINCENITLLCTFTENGLEAKVVPSYIEKSHTKLHTEQEKIQTTINHLESISINVSFDEAGNISEKLPE